MIRQERGNALLVGVGGTGKQSLTRLAAHMCGYRCFEIELSRGYNYDSFHEDLRKLYKMAGVEGKDMVFLFTDTQVCRKDLPVKRVYILIFFSFYTSKYNYYCPFSLAFVDCGGGVFGGHQQHAELWRGA